MKDMNKLNLGYFTEGKKQYHSIGISINSLIMARNIKTII